jgi:predicted Zn finger-like uncharacterized protein
MNASNSRNIRVEDGTASMIIYCPNCGAKYRIDPVKLPDKGVHLRCKKCSHKFFVNSQVDSKVQERSEKSDRVASKQPEGAGQQTTTDPTLKTPAVEDNILPKIEKVDQYVAAGNPEAAAALLVELISRHARKREFTSAESLRDKLYDVAPMALNEIVKANEIIEEEKGRSIDAGHLKLWADLYDTLESDESSELYYAMKPVSVKAGQPVYEKGSLDSNLYFLQQGRVSMVHWDNTRDQEVILKEISPGGFFNQDAFFSFTVATSTIIAAQDSELTYLEKPFLDRWEQQFAGLGPKLNSYCRNGENMYDLAKKAGIELRTDPRILTSLPALIQFVDPSGKPQKKPFKVVLFDIAAGGTSFELKLMRKSEADQLLGQHILMQMQYVFDKNKRKVLTNGRVIAAHLQPFGLSAIHVQFDTPIADETLQDIEKVSGQIDEMA